MSKEAHPNIHAVAVASDLIESIRRNLRGDAKEIKNQVMHQLEPDIVNAMVNISISIDKIIETWYKIERQKIRNDRKQRVKASTKHT